MEKLTREYYTVSNAAELLGCKVDELIHLGATGKLPIYAMPKEWWGNIFDQSFVEMRDNESVYGRTPERTMIRDLAEGKLWPGTVQFFEDGDEEVTVKSIKLSPNPETGKLRQVDLDVPVVIKRSQLYVFTEDVLFLAGSNKSIESKGGDEDESKASTVEIKVHGHRIDTLECYAEWQRQADEIVKTNRSYKSKSAIAKKIHIKVSGGNPRFYGSERTIREHIIIKKFQD